MNGQEIKSAEENQETQQNPKTSITITFMEVGSALFDLRIVNPVTPNQILAVAEWLRIMGEAQLLQQQMDAVQREAAHKIAIPHGKIKL